MSLQNRFGIKTLFGMATLVLLWTSPLSAQNPCAAEIEFTNPKPPVTDKIDLNIFSTTGRGCLPAEIRLMAAFYDSQLNIVCSEVIESIAVQNANVQSTNIEVRPRNMVEFAGLRTAANVPPKRLFCLNPDTDTEINPRRWGVHRHSDCAQQLFRRTVAWRPLRFGSLFNSFA